ncbi:MAG: ATP-binding protein, partial [Sandaracinaceae bacterium]
TNLVGNALKFTTEGHVTLAVSMEEKQVRFAAQDTGIGIAAENLERIFQAFEQADSSTTRRHGGTGLGLDISRRLVALMGGALEVESELGVGSRFWFDLPLRPASSVERSRSKPHRVAIAIADEVEREAVAAALRFAGHHVVAPPEAEVVVHEDPSAQGGVCIVPPSGLADAGDRVRLARPFGAQALARAVRKAAGRTSSPPASSRVGGRVLLADDAEVNRKVIATQLAHLGYETVVVVDGEAAVRAVEEGPAFDVIMLDISMPAMDGYETARAIRALERGRGPRRAPMFALTGFQGEEHREQAMEAGFDRFLLKPLRLSDLDAVLTEARAHALPVIADDAWGQLVQLDDGSGAFLTEVVDGFLIRAEERMKLLAESRDVAATAHALKGSAAQLGARALQHACAELENEPDRLDDLLPVVTHELARASEELLHRIRPAPTSGGPASIVRVTLSDRLTREAVERALADAEPALSEGSAMLFDCRAMTGYEEDARGAFVAWHRTHQDRMGRVAIVTRRPLWRLVVSIMALGSGVAMRAFEDEDDALAWLEES